jgi:hypothetical protein
MEGNHYVPILRWKAAERDALAKLDVNVRLGVTPLFEFIMPPPKLDKNRVVVENSKMIFLRKLPNTIGEINKCSHAGSVFVDVHLVDGDLRAMTLESILDSSGESGALIVPVIHIFPEQSSSADMLTRKIAVQYGRSSTHGSCLRINRVSLVDPNLATGIRQFVDTNGLRYRDTDLLIDLGIVSVEDNVDKIADVLSAIPRLDQWRNFIVAGGAFPKDLAQFEKHSHPEIPRYDWRLVSGLSRSGRLARVPSYSDYTIQHPVFYENQAFPNVSASIRYTSDDQWDVLRGEGLNNQKGAGYLQYIAHAKLIVKQPFFKGAKYSYGDDYIIERADPNNANSGNPMTWLRAGINHHITVVVKQLANSAVNAVST